VKKTNITAKSLRGILSVLVFALIALSATGFYFAQNWLLDYAVSISHTVADSNASGNKLQSLSQLERELADRQDVIVKASTLIAPIGTYQSQAINDLNKYAADAGISISNYGFTQPGAATAKSASGTSIITATLASPVSYTKLLKFMDAVESNLPKMQISSVNLGRVSGGDSDSVRIDQLTIEVYTQ
jgi:hypothetical protein